jgi:hypothetical protein
MSSYDNRKIQKLIDQLLINHITNFKFITFLIEKCDTSLESCFQGYNFELENF